MDHVNRSGLHAFAAPLRRCLSLLAGYGIGGVFRCTSGDKCLGASGGNAALKDTQGRRCGGARPTGKFKGSSGGAGWGLQGT